MELTHKEFTAIKNICSGKDIFFRWQLRHIYETKRAALGLDDPELVQKLKKCETAEALAALFSLSDNNEAIKRQTIAEMRAQKEYLLQSSFVSQNTQNSKKFASTTLNIQRNAVHRYNTCRFSRKFGFDMFMSIKLAKNRKPDETCFSNQLDWSQEPFCLGKWEFLCSKLQDRKLLYIRTDKPAITGDRLNADFVRDWLVNREINRNQTLSKYNSRISMAFSTTVCLDFALIASEYDVIDDIDNAHDGDSSIMTDGCGLISFSLMQKIAYQLELPQLPCAVQGRFGSCKGLWVLAEEKYMDGKLLRSRKSQEKFSYDGIPAEEHRTLEILSHNRPFDAYLHTAAVLFLVKLGVKEDDIIQLANEALEEKKAQWFESTESALANVRASAKIDDTLSGSLKEMLLAGFSPRNEGVAEKIKKLMSYTVEDVQQKGRIFVPKGVSLLMVPDHTRTLKEGEIFVQFSDRTKYDCHILQGNIVLYRAPIQLLSDVQIMKAVDYPELHDFYDCIVFSTNGNESPASLLSGGDYDGDLAFVLWDERFLGIKCLKKDNSTDISQYAGPHPIGTQKQSSFCKPGDLQVALLKYSCSQGRNSYLGKLTMELQHLLELSLCKSDEQTEQLIKVVGNLCAVAVDAAKAGTLIEEPKLINYNKKNRSNRCELIKKLKEITVTFECDHLDVDLLIDEENLDTFLIHEAARKLSCIQGKPWAYLEMVKADLTITYPCINERVQFAATCYTLAKSGALPEWKANSNKLIYFLFMKEFCRLKADAISLRNRGTISYSVARNRLI